MARSACIARPPTIIGLRRFHHRETPERILANQSDAGMVWKTEVLAAQRGGAHIEEIALLEEDSLRTEVSYVIGTLKTSKHLEASVAFLSFLRLPECQNAYAKFGFVEASDSELQLKPIP
jgi:ABC-type molybdate transport system substrate-binding protein